MFSKVGTARILALALAGVALWACMTWPLARHFNDAVAYTARCAPNEPEVYALKPCDNLQLLYHFWLCRDMLAGGTPAFANIYEFNTGDDGAMRRFSPYYVPFSLVYAAVSPLAGNAAGWNASLLFSALLGIFGLYALARRFTDRQGPAIVAAIVAAAFPYNWITAMIGSPTGFAICLVPWILYGLDKAVREQSPRGGFIAGLALLAAYCADLHVFYFVSLASAPWVAIAFAVSPMRGGPVRQRLTGAFVGLIPFGLLAAAALVLAAAMSGDLNATTMSGGRTLNEIKIFSPILSGLFRWQILGAPNHIFFGTGLATLIAFGSLAFIARQVRRGCDWRRAAFLAALFAALAAVVLLALGAYGPLNALPIRLARKLIPQYGMIRQPAKIFCLAPSLVAAILATLFNCLRSRRTVAIAAVLAIVAIAEQAAWLRPGLCAIPDSIPAYKAAAEYASEKGIERPHAVCLPLWPGDSHYASIYECGIIGTRIRLVNGYSPSVPAGYFENVFSKLESLNCGVFTEEQRELLEYIGVNLVIFHEQPYPANVSPFTSAVALKRLRRNPALKEIAAKEGVFVFAFTGGAAKDIPLPGNIYDFPAAAQWLASRLLPVAQDDSGTGVMRPIMRAPLHYSDELRYKMLLTGGGTLRGELGTVIEVPDSPTWVSVPFLQPFGEKFHAESGKPVILHALLTEGDDEPFVPGDLHIWHACELFHLGFTDPADGSVTFAPDRNVADILLRGPDLPFPKGRYRATLIATVCDGEVLSASTVGDGERVLASKPLSAKTTVHLLEFEHDGLLPLRLEYRYGRTGETRVKSLMIERLR